MHEGEGRRVIPVSNSGIGISSQNSGIGISSRNSGIGRSSWEFRAIPELEPIPRIPESVGIPYNSVQFRVDAIAGIPFRNWM
jgi:hypothetical protein